MHTPRCMIWYFGEDSVDEQKELGDYDEIPVDPDPNPEPNPLPEPLPGPVPMPIPEPEPLPVPVPDPVPQPAPSPPVVARIAKLVLRRIGKAYDAAKTNEDEFTSSFKVNALPAQSTFLITHAPRVHTNPHGAFLRGQLRFFVGDCWELQRGNNGRDFCR